MLIHRLTALVIVLSALTGNARAAEKEPPLYHVEVLVFAYTDPSATKAEDWTDSGSIALPANLIQLSVPNLETASDAKPRTPVAKKSVPPYQLLGPDSFKLSSSAAKLRKSSRYEVLLHTAWRQPAFEFKENSGVYLYEGMNEPQHPMERPADVTTTPDATPGATPSSTPSVESTAPIDLVAPVEQSEPRPLRYSGVVKLGKGTYLHTDVDFMLRRTIALAAAPGEKPETTLQGFHINESRRIKPGEIHYFDHPTYGVLVLVTQLERSKASDVEKETPVGDKPIETVPDD